MQKQQYIGYGIQHLGRLLERFFRQGSGYNLFSYTWDRSECHISVGVYGKSVQLHDTLSLHGYNIPGCAAYWPPVAHGLLWQGSWTVRTSAQSLDSLSVEGLVVLVPGGCC